ncbi:MAG: hypothetical protein ACYSTY_04355 [Planctomycetota bacterium]
MVDVAVAFSPVLDERGIEVPKRLLALPLGAHAAKLMEALRRVASQQHHPAVDSLQVIIEPLVFLDGARPVVDGPEAEEQLLRQQPVAFTLDLRKLPFSPGNDVP